MPSEPLEKKLPEGSLEPVGFHERLEHAMRARKVSKQSLEQKIGKSRGYVSRTLVDRRDPGLSAIMEFAEALGVRVGWLAAGEGKMDESSPVGETYDQLEGWSEAAEQAAQDRRWSTIRYAIVAAGRRPVLVKPEKVTPEFVIATARHWLDFAPESEREAAEMAEVERIRGRDDED